MSKNRSLWIGTALIFGVALVGCDNLTPEERFAKDWREHHEEIVADIRDLVAAGRLPTAKDRIKDYQSAGIKDPRLDEILRIAEASRLRSLAGSAQTLGGKIAALTRLATLELATATERDELKLLQQQLQQQLAQAAKEEGKRLADKKKHDTQLQLAGAGALMLKRAAKDPEAFELKSLLIMPNGTACYGFRAKNSFGAILPSSAVLTNAGKMLLQEHDGNAFVSAWNKNCTLSGGDEIAPLVKRLGILD